MGHPVSDHGDSLCDSVRGTHSVRPTPDWYLKQRDCEMRHFHVISFGGKFARALLSDPKSPAHFRIVWYFLLFFKKVDRKNWAPKNSDNYPRCVINEDLTKNSNAYLQSNLQIAIFWKTKEAVRKSYQFLGLLNWHQLLYWWDFCSHPWRILWASAFIIIYWNQPLTEGLHFSFSNRKSR